MLTLTVDSHIWADESDFPDEILDVLKRRLTLTNKEYSKALEMGLDTTDIEKEIVLYDTPPDLFLMPRGFAPTLAEILDNAEVEFEFDDCRVCLPHEPFGNEIPLRPEQVKIADAIMEVEQGYGKSPTASGKTVACLAAIDQIGKTLVIVNTMEIADQWVERIHEWLGEDYPTGFIGDGEFEISETGITVATVQTIWSRRAELWEEGFFDTFSGVCLDECHHGNARTYRWVMNQFSAKYRWGVSATPEKTGDPRIMKLVLGDQFVEVTEKDVEHSVMKPTIEVIPTQFDMEYESFGGGRNNYQKILSALSEDDDRNQLIVDELMTNHRDHANLIISKRLEHLSQIWETLVAAGYPAEQIFTIVGKDERADRAASAEAASLGQCVVLSTLADEALDIKRLDRIHLIFPTKNPGLVKQQVGRIRRKHPDKLDAVVLDYHDWQVKPFHKQYMARRHEVYNPMGWPVKKRKRIL